MALSLSRTLRRQVKEALKTIEVFVNSVQPSKDNTGWDNIRDKFNELNVNLTEMIGKLNQDNETDSHDHDRTKSGVIEDYGKFMTRVSKNRNPSALRELATLYYSMPESLFLGVGTPNSDLYPFKSVHVNLKNGTTLKMSGDPLKMVLSYLPSAGYAPLQTIFKDLQDKFHGPQDWAVKDVLITSGAQEGTALTINMLLNPGDPLLVQNPVYPGFAEIIRPMEVDAIPVNVDGDGMVPEHLIQILEERSKMTDKPMPKSIYINPTASNPTGTLLSDDRKKQIYAIAQRYGLIILEDDPYYFVHFRDRDPVSFLSMDTDYRVIRFDSFSKTLSAGLRLGYVTAPKPFIDRINLHMQVTTMHASGLPQLLIYELLSQWGYEGYCQHLVEVRKFYKRRRDITLQAAETYLKGLCTWNIPQGGMFLWVTIIHPVQDLRHFITVESLKEKVIVAPGYAFNLDPTNVGINQQNFRISYSVASEEDLTEGIKRLGKLIKENQSKSFADRPEKSLLGNLNCTVTSRHNDIFFVTAGIRTRALRMLHECSDHCAMGAHNYA
ncbi:hypothetical protein WDU94_011265 [Cyamophila willieti]